MKNCRVAFFAAVLAIAAAALGQATRGDVVVDVPFAFTAGGQQLPAGHYVVAPGTDVIRIFNAHNTGLYVPTHAAVRSGADGSKLVFHRYGEKYFLSEIWITGNNFGRELFRSRAEKDAAAEQSEMELAVVRPVK